MHAIIKYFCHLAGPWFDQFISYGRYKCVYRISFDRLQCINTCDCIENSIQKCFVSNELDAKNWIKWYECLNLNHLIFWIEHEIAIDCALYFCYEFVHVPSLFNAFSHGNVSCVLKTSCITRTAQFEYAQHDKYVVHFNFTSMGLLEQ